jgi:undecaprenyl diphosphate synthase
MSDSLILHTLPEHVAVIMDGNGRWAKKKGAARIFGHKNAIKAVREVTEGCAELKIGYLTLYAFSTENWSRPQEEVNGLMALLVSALRKELKTLKKNNVKLITIGDREGLPANCQLELHEVMEETKQHTGLVLILALNYSGRWEILKATRAIAKKIESGGIDPEHIDEQIFSEHLDTRGIPNPELLIRTSGELRISNFLLWQIAYSELYFTNILWPDFRKKDLYDALESFQKRERRFGKTSEQVLLK